MNIRVQSTTVRFINLNHAVISGKVTREEQRSLSVEYVNTLQGAFSEEVLELKLGERSEMVIAVPTGLSGGEVQIVYMLEVDQEHNWSPDIDYVSPL